MRNKTKFIRTTKKDNFTIISNSIIQSEILTTDESFLLIFILSLPNNWSLNKGYLEGSFKSRGLSKSRFNASWKGLIEKGYIHKERNRCESGKFNSWNYTVIEDPNITEVSKTDKSDNQDIGNPTSRKLGDIINTNREKTNRKSKEDKNTDDIYNMLGTLGNHRTPSGLKY